MKACIIKQYYDILGPICSFKYDEITIKKLLDLHITKLNGFETFLFLKADHYILNSYNFKRNECEIIRNNALEYDYANTYTKTLGKTIDETDIKFDGYDIVWCRDPILKNIKEYKQKYPQVLFVYEEVEHSRGYCSNTSKYYDLILRHDWININWELKNMPLEIAFPYPKCPKILREYFDIKKNPNLYVDYRDIMKYTLGQELAASLKTYENDKKKIINRFNNIKSVVQYPLICNLVNSVNGLCISADGKSDCEEYLQKLALSKYFTSTFGRVGQSLVDAVELNCICFGTSLSPNHKLLCHPFTLFNGFQTIEAILVKIEEIERNKNLEEEILKYQNERLYKYYVYYQINILEKALALKKF